MPSSRVLYFFQTHPLALFFPISILLGLMESRVASTHKNELIPEKPTIQETANKLKAR